MPLIYLNIINRYLIPFMHASKVSSQAPSLPVLGVIGISLLLTGVLPIYFSKEVSLKISCFLMMGVLFTWAYSILTKPYSTASETTRSTTINSVNSHKPILKLQEKDLVSLNEKLKEELQLKSEALKNSEEKLYHSQEELKEKQQQLVKLEKRIKECEKQAQETVLGYQKKEKELIDKQEKQSILVKEYQTTITQQREIIEKKQKLNTQLEGKVRDLSYEIKALLQLEDFPGQHPKPLLPHNEQLPQASFDHYDIHQLYNTLPDKSQKSPYDAFSLLNKYKQQAESFSSPPAFSSNPLSSNRFHLDLRHLFEILEGEQQFVLLLYSYTESRLIFANKRVKEVLGYPPESFCHNFPHIVQKGKALWQEQLQELSPKESRDFRLILKSHNQEDMLFHCYLSQLSKGIFTSLTLAMLVPK